MSCSACSARIERGMAELPGVSGVSVNLLKNSMTISYDEMALSDEGIIAAVRSLGYGAASRERGRAQGEAKPGAASAEASGLRRRLIVSAIFTVPLFYIAMGEMMGAPLPFFLSGMENAGVFAFTQLLLTVPVLVAGRGYYITGFKNLIKRSPNMDSLIALGSGAAVLYGVYALYKILWAFGHGYMEVVHHFSMDLYFESAAVILTLITLGKFFEVRAKGRTGAAIEALMNLAPKTARVLRDGHELEISAREIVIGDILVVRSGEALAADGVLIEGTAALDESALTGESMPVQKQVGDRVIGATTSRSGYFKMRVTEIGDETALSKIIVLVDEATSSKAPIARLADRVCGFFVPFVIVIAAVAAIFWAALGHGFEFSLRIFISVLVISCPCALGLATPTAIMVGGGLSASRGILVKSAEALEGAHNVRTIVLDKTNTITTGKPVVTDIFPLCDEMLLLQTAASIEAMSSHPLATAIVAHGKKRGIEFLEASDFSQNPGRGVSAVVAGERCLAGNAEMMHDAGLDTAMLSECAKIMSTKGETALYFARGGELLGIISIADTIRPTSAEAVRALKSMGLNVIMLTGDNSRTASAIAKGAGIDTVISEVFPDEKQTEIKRLQDMGQRVCMVGDGINDAPALAQADVGVAIGAGVDVALEAADIVLMKSDLLDVAVMISLSHATMRKIKQNLFWAFIYNIIGIPIAAGVLFLPFGILLNPMIAAAAMSMSSVCVVTNALTLRLFKVHRKNEQIKEQEKMTKTVKVSGMSCAHCQRAVEKALMALDGVSEVCVKLEEGCALITLEHEVSSAEVKAALEEEGFGFSGME